MDITYNEDNMRYEIEKGDVTYCTVDGKPDDLAEAKELLTALFPEIDKIDQKARVCAAEELLDTKNKSWLEEGEEPLTAEIFMRRLQLTEVEFDMNAVMFWYEDNDMFWGHTVMVMCDGSGMPDSAELMG